MTQLPRSSPVSPSLSLADAVFIGLASMLGAGVFVVFAPATLLAGNLLPLSILLAALVAYLNAGSVSQLARKVTRSGGAYSYGREYLSATWGFLAGAAFVIGKIGSAAAIALTLANYLWPEQKILIGVSSVIVMALINILGINRTALGSWILASMTLLFLFVILAASFFYISKFGMQAVPEPESMFGPLTASALFFFAFAGYARIATLSGEVKNGSKNIPRAITISLGIVLFLYLSLGFVLQGVLGFGLGSAMAPLAEVLNKAIPWLPSGVVLIFVSSAALGSLLALLAGISRTTATMAEDAELPRLLALRGKRFGAPWVAEVSISMLVIGLVLMGDLVWAIGISSFAVLVYYAVANLAAYRQPSSHSSRPKNLNLLGLFLCLLLAFFVPFESLIAGVLALCLVFGIRLGLSRSSSAR